MAMVRDWCARGSHVMAPINGEAAATATVIGRGKYNTTSRSSNGISFLSSVLPTLINY